MRDVSERRAHASTLALAPAGWRTWQELIDARSVEPGQGERLGRLLAAWQGQTADASEAARRFEGPDRFFQLRIEPYYRQVMTHSPELAEGITPYVERLVATRRCFVHGDLAPPTILVAPEGVWVEDFGVAHFGDPAFDPAFFLHHLMLEAIRHPEVSGDLEACAQGFWRAWRSGLPDDLRPDEEYVLGHVGCLLVAAGLGSEVADLHEDRECAIVLTHGKALLYGPPSDLRAAWPYLHAPVL